MLVKQANKQCQEYIDEINFSFNFGTGADENTDLSNGNWLENTDNALNKINDLLYLHDCCSLIKQAQLNVEALEDFGVIFQTYRSGRIRPTSCAHLTHTVTSPKLVSLVRKGERCTHGNFKTPKPLQRTGGMLLSEGPRISYPAAAAARRLLLARTRYRRLAVGRADPLLLQAPRGEPLDTTRSPEPVRH